MIPTSLNHKPALARGLLLIFAFAAWPFTGVANGALALLTLLFLTEIPAHRGQLRREPAVWLIAGVAIVTGLLGLRAAWLFPAIAGEQWQGIWAWTAPLLFLVVAWWLRRDPDWIWPVLAATALGLVLGVLHNSDWSMLPAMLGGIRYHFGYAALGLAFVASVMLVGLFLFRSRIAGLRIGGRPRPLLGWALWLLGLAFVLFVLTVTQSRGAAASLAIIGALYALLQRRERRRRGGISPRQARLALASALLFVALAGWLLWTTKDRQLQDFHELTVGSRTELSYNDTASVAIRLNLATVGMQVFAAGPLLGFGPGTSTTEFLVPQRVVTVSDYQLAHAPAASHLHSVAVEILTRFGLVGVLIAVLLGALLGRAYNTLWSDPRAAPDLRAFLTLTGVMLLLYCVYDFRLMNLDLRFFCILFFGILYSVQLARPDYD